MLKTFHIDQTIMARKNGKIVYRLNEQITYFSPRYGKTITVPEGRDSDGATGAFDIVSRGWWVHDELCKWGAWDDGTKLSNWQCSQVLQDILTEEGRERQGKRWFWATWLLGGGKARKNGMITVTLLCLLMLQGCTTVNCSQQTGERNTVKSDQEQTPTSTQNVKLPIPIGGIP